MSGSADPAEAKHALELQWHEAHPDVGEEEQISRYKKLVLRRLRERQWAMLGAVAGKRLLDVGCGVGRETIELARQGARVVAVDLSPALVARARSRAAEAGVADRVEFRVAAAEALAADGERFDVVIGNGVLHHLDLPAFKDTLSHLMAPGGVAQFQEPLIHNPLLRLYRAITPHLHSPTERPLAQGDISNFVHGFSHARIEYFNFLGLFLLPAPYLLGDRLSAGLLDLTLGLDRRLVALASGLRRFCQYVVIQIGAPA
ncbi:MAG TPA: methyltransferase domain-containing protein [Gemmatimonadales bacterium]|nr:methyltransferase domain-containing protein [Gemmatimonadales bacterium]